ncbi:outer membrane protein assembly factor BamA [Desulfosarcina variabilis]|uniref:outer membrane protein assembly factor BamA n=1 Tax=Desulfosarcina variabilis TaxID=2300 RepID=UPI003AFA2F95
MLRRYTVILSILYFVVLQGTATAALSTVRVLVLPFTIHADQDLSYLKTDIPKVIGEHLESEGAVLLEINDAQKNEVATQSSNVDALRQMGLDVGADSVIWGSMTRIGNHISLDTNLVETMGGKPVQSVYEAATGMESLRMVTQKTAEKLARQLFHRELITHVRIEGNRRIESDAIERVIRTKAGDILRVGELSNDLKNIHKMGYFDDIRVEAEDTDGGKAIVFHVKEKPTIRRISFSGNQVFKDEELRENMTISTGSILNIFTIKSNIEQLQIMYKEKNYHNIKISYAVHDLENNQADIEFVIEEGEKIKIKTITFQGNTTFSDKKLKKWISTSEKGFWSWLTSSGELNREDLSQDVQRLMAFYHTTGFIHAKVADPIVDFEDKWIYITFKIDEGERFKVGTMDVDGDLIHSKDRLMPALGIVKEPFFNQETVRKDVLALTDIYEDAGYAYVEIVPLTKEHPDTHLVDITYRINKHSKVYFESINISGNTRTRDKVIRRELRIHEQALYSGRELKRSVRNLHRLDYFEDIKVDTPRGGSDDTMDVNIEVVEKPTGNFTFGAGYSTVDKLFVTGSITEKNLFGRGQIIKLSGQVGGTSDLYNLSFTEPWMFDIPLRGTANIYRTRREYDTYDKTSMGGGGGVSYRIFDYTWLGLSYRYDVTTLDDIDDNASDNIKDLKGKHDTSAITTTLSYDSRDKVFNTTEGQDHRLSYTFAGLGSDIGYHKIVGELGWYIPVYKGLVSFLHGEAGHVEERSGYILPDYEKFYLGGMNSLRGFDFQDVNIKTTNSDGEDSEEGGEKYVQFNFELTYPLLKDIGIVGVIFYDTGNVFAPDESIALGTLRHCAGYGLRWYSPIGPIRIEAGHILDPKEGENSHANWEFTMGAAF